MHVGPVTPHERTHREAQVTQRAAKTQADIARLIRAAKAAGETPRSIRALADGTVILDLGVAATEDTTGSDPDTELVAFRKRHGYA